MFKHNKYTKWYFNIIEKASNDSDFEKHHITPKSLGGTDLDSNIVKLSYREHYICHLLLTKMCKDKQHEIKMCWALHRLTFTRKHFSSHEYELTRKIHIRNLKENHPSKDMEWRHAVTKRVLQDWNNNETRRKNMIVTMKKWRDDNPERALEISRNNGKHGLFGKDSAVVIPIEYEGVTYYGWRELKENTGVSKHLYKKYYLKGLPFHHRIGANGPVAKGFEI